MTETNPEEAGSQGPDDEPVPTTRTGGDAVDDVDEADADADDDDDVFDAFYEFDETEKERRPPLSAGRVAVGVACLVLGIIAVFLAVQALTGDDDDTATTTAATSAPGGTDQGASGASTTAAAQAVGWPPTVQARPVAFGPSGPPPATAGDLAPGWYLWSDFNDWHLWLVGGEGQDASAVVTTNDELTIKDTFGEAAVEPTSSSATVRRGLGSAPIAGIDFNPGFYGNEVTVTITGDLPLRTGQGTVEAATPLVLRYGTEG